MQWGHRDIRAILIAPYSPIGRTADPHLGASNKIESVRRILSRFGKVLHINTAHNRIGFHASVEHSFPGGSELDLPTYGYRKIGKLLQWLLAQQLGGRFVGKEGFDIVWVYNTYCTDARLALSLLRRNPQAKLVVEIEDWPDARARGGTGAWKERLDGSYLGKLLDRADLVTVVNPRMRSRRELSHIRSIMDLACILAPEAVASGARGTHPDGSRVVGYFGGLNREKGADIFLEAVGRIADEPESARFRFVVCGTGELAEAASNLSRASAGRMEFHHGVSRGRVYELMRGCDTIVNPHRPLLESGSDGIFPFKVMEILASGARLVSTPLPEELVPRWAYLPIDPDVESLVAAVRGISAGAHSNAPGVRELIAGYLEDAVAGTIAAKLGL